MIHSGTVMEIKNNRAYIFTQSCDMVQIRAREEYLLGQQVHFSDRDMLGTLRVLRLADYRHMRAAVIALLLVAAIVIAAVVLPRNIGGLDTVCAAVFSVDINPSLELSVNKDMKVIDIAYTNEDGSAFSSELNIKSKTVSEALSEIYELAGRKGYLAEGRIVLVSAAPNSSEPGKTYESQVRGILSAFEREAGPDVYTVYVGDSGVISQARETDLSIGKLLLYQYAVGHGYDVTVQEIRESSVNEILALLNVDAADVVSADSETGESIGATASPDISPSEAPSPSTESSPSPSPSPAPPPISGGFDPKLSVSVSGSRLKFSWTPVTGSSFKYNGTTYDGFKYYKVVASDNDPTPVYPENGYIQAVSDMGAPSWSTDPSGGSYNESPKLKSGVKYYFAVTYVFENGSFTSNTVSMTVPEYDDQPASPAPVFESPQLSVTVGGETLYFNWTPLPDRTITYGGTTYKNFSYAKLVASRDDPTPVYPDDGYLYYASDPASSGWSVTPVMDNYNHSPELEPGQTYYFAVTYVFDNGKFVSNTVTATVPDYTEPDVPAVTDASLTVEYGDGLLLFDWTPLPDYTVDYQGTRYKNFSYYKVVASETNPHPVYPDDGYIHVASGLLESQWSADPASLGLESGKTYYLAVTYVFENDKYVSNTVTFTIP